MPRDDGQHCLLQAQSLPGGGSDLSPGGDGALPQPPPQLPHHHRRLIRQTLLEPATDQAWCRVPLLQCQQRSQHLYPGELLQTLSSKWISYQSQHWSETPAIIISVLFSCFFKGIDIKDIPNVNDHDFSITINGFFLVRWFDHPLILEDVKFGAEGDDLVPVDISLVSGDI